MNMENKIIIECECGTHLLQVVSDKQDGFHSFYFAMFGYGTQRNFWRRVKYAWLMFRDKAYSDQLIFTPEEAKKLCDFIKTHSEESHTSE
jgi:hypothetical protein